jgi:hypothetical protein
LKVGSQLTKPFSSEMGFFVGCVKKVGGEASQMGTIRASMDIGRTVLDVTKLRRLRRLDKKRIPGNTRMQRRILEWETEEMSKKENPEKICMNGIR